MDTAKRKILIIGAGLAGSECAHYLASSGHQIFLVESKQIKPTPAQKLKSCAELVCTNSLKSLRPDSAHGILKNEMEALGSLILTAAKLFAVPAGDALAVDREKFSQYIHNALESHPNITLIAREAFNPLELMQEYDCQHVVIATGPLTSPGLEEWIVANLSSDDFYFYDAIAPVVEAESLNMEKLFFMDRYGQFGQGDYLNVPMNKDEYEQFISELIKAEKVPCKDFEQEKFFEACLPIDVMAQRGRDTARFSCMKPVGLEPEGGKRAYAVVQLRKENLLGSAFNLVGFQTRLTYKEQLRVFKMIPGFENANFLHLGSVHRNSFLNSKKLLNFDLASKQFPQLSFAGQIVGVEGYTESASIGLYLGYQLNRKLQGLEVRPFPRESAIGALINYIMTWEKASPSSINFGLMPSVELSREELKSKKGRKKVKQEKVATRAVQIFSNFMSLENQC